MLGGANVNPTVAVKDMAAAKEFYGGTLGLEQVDSEDPGGGVLYKSGDCKLYVYPSSYAGTNKATYASWHVSDIAAEVADLKAKGVKFQTFELPGVTWDGDIATMGDFKSAWFSDPDGNTLALDNGM